MTTTNWFQPEPGNVGTLDTGADWDTPANVGVEDGTVADATRGSDTESAWLKGELAWTAVVGGQALLTFLQSIERADFVALHWRIKAAQSVDGGDPTLGNVSVQGADNAPFPSSPGSGFSLPNTDQPAIPASSTGLTWLTGTIPDNSDPEGVYDALLHALQHGSPFLVMWCQVLWPGLAGGPDAVEIDAIQLGIEVEESSDDANLGGQITVFSAGTGPARRSYTRRKMFTRRK